MAVKTHRVAPEPRPLVSCRAARRRRRAGHTAPAALPTLHYADAQPPHHRCTPPLLRPCCLQHTPPLPMTAHGCPLPAHPQAVHNHSGGVVVVEESGGEPRHDGRAAGGGGEEGWVRPGSEGKCEEPPPLHCRPASPAAPAWQGCPAWHTPLSPACPSPACTQQFRAANRPAHLNTRPGQRPPPPSSTLCTRLSRRAMAVACAYPRAMGSPVGWLAAGARSSARRLAARPPATAARHAGRPSSSLPSCRMPGTAPTSATHKPQHPPA